MSTLKCLGATCQIQWHPQLWQSGLSFQSNPWRKRKNSQERNSQEKSSGKKNKARDGSKQAITHLSDNSRNINQPRGKVRFRRKWGGDEWGLLAMSARGVRGQARKPHVNKSGPNTSSFALCFVSLNNYRTSGSKLDMYIILRTSYIQPCGPIQEMKL